MLLKEVALHEDARQLYLRQLQKKLSKLVGRGRVSITEHAAVVEKCRAHFTTTLFYKSRVRQTRNICNKTYRQD